MTSAFHRRFVVVLLAMISIWLPSAQASGGASAEQVVFTPGGFTDDDGSVHESDIEALAAAGITRGCNPPDNDHFCPTTTTTRDQIASLLVRALHLPPTDTDHFTDDTGSIHEADINALATAGITRGCNPPDNDHFCPTTTTTRDQTASFLVRALSLSPVTVWPRVHDAEFDTIPGSSWVERLAGGDLGYVGAGLILALEDDAAVWTSPDAVNWTLVPNEDGIFGGPGQEIGVFDVAVGPPAMVAVGRWSTSNGSFDGDAAVWRSKDGSTWSRVPHDETVFGDPGNARQSMESVDYGASVGFVAVGGEASTDPGTEDVAAVWVSSDGLEWTRVADPDGELAGDRAQQMTQVRITNNLVVAAGLDAIWTEAAFWWSPDGISWIRSPDIINAASAGSVAITGLIDGPTGFVAVGFEAESGSSAPVSFTSPDGRAWTRHSIPISSASRAAMTDVAHDGSKYVAVGETNGTISVWISADGATWERIGERLGPTPDRRVRSVLATDHGLIAGGSHTVGHAFHGAIWANPG